MNGCAFDVQLYDIFSAILHKNFSTYVSMPSKFLHNLTKNLPYICTPITVQCSPREKAGFCFYGKE